MIKSTFKVRLLQIFISIIILLGIVIVFTFYSQTKSMALDLSKQISNQVVGKTEERVSNYLSVPASLTRITGSLVNPENIIEDHEFLWEYMWQPLIMTPQIESFFVADELGNYVQVRRTPRYATRTIDRTAEPVLDSRQYRLVDYSVVEVEATETSWDPRTRPWYLNTKQEETYYWVDAYIGTTSRKPVIGCSYPVLNERGGLGAVVCVNIPLEDLSLFLKDQKISKNSYVFIVDQNNQIIAFPDVDQVLLTEGGGNGLRLRKFHELEVPHLVAVYDKLIAGGGTNIFLEQEEDNYFVTVKQIPTELGINWRIITVIPESDLLENVYRIIRNVLFIFTGLFLFSIVVIYVVSNKITQPLVELSLKNRKLQNFDLDLGEPIESSIREISQMSESLFNAAAGLSAFKKYVPADLVRSLIATGHEANVGGEPKALTIFFTDIAGFTSISENMASDYLMQHLSEYFDSLSNIIMDEKGTIDKYIGDSIMAFWGAPQDNDTSEYDACMAALRCQEALKKLNETWANVNKPVMKTRIGLASGRVVVGNVGSQERLNYSVIGDSVNLASRLEGLNKYYGTNIIISENIYHVIKDDFHCRFLDIAAVVGKDEGMRIYELLAEKSVELPKVQQQFLIWYENGLKCYLTKDWSKALAYFVSIKKKLKIEDKAVDLFIQRCLRYKQNGNLLPDDWDGVFRFTKK